MTGEVRVYVEGGGDSKATKKALRLGLSQFLRDLVEAAREVGAQWQIIACGSRQDTFNGFRHALRSHPAAFNVLLVDSEGPVASGPRDHLARRDGWPFPRGVDDCQCHLMVQMMEAWLVADPDALERFYGQGFRRNAIPSQPDVEMIERPALLACLARATEDTTKGEYHKTNHAPKLLAMVDPGRVRRAARHCERLFSALLRVLDSGPS
jgi:hypothetical protein